jgi:WD40 repeat protein
MVFKPHNATVLDISFCPTCPLFATTGADGTVFFFDTNSGLRGSSWAPLKFVRIAPPMDVPGRTLPPTAPSTNKIVCEKISWRLTSDISSVSNDSTIEIIAGTGTETDTAVCCCSDGVMREFSVGHLVTRTPDSREISELSTYETTVSTVERVVRVPLGFSLPPPPSALISLSVRSNSVALSSPIGATASMPMSPVQPGKETSSASQVRKMQDLSVLWADLTSSHTSISTSLLLLCPSL